MKVDRAPRGDKNAMDSENDEDAIDFGSWRSDFVLDTELSSLSDLSDTPCSSELDDSNGVVSGPATLPLLHPHLVLAQHVCNDQSPRDLSEVSLQALESR
jgi:hypothetical protein